MVLSAELITQMIAGLSALVAVAVVIRSNGKADGRTQALIEGLQKRDEKLSGAMKSETALLAKLAYDTEANKTGLADVKAAVADMSGVLTEVRDGFIEMRAESK